MTNKPEQAVFEAVRDKGSHPAGHPFNPDGDALGSLLGLAEILEGLGAAVLLPLRNRCRISIASCSGCGQIQTDMAKVRNSVAQAQGDFLTVCLDCGDAYRLGRNSAELIGFRPLVVIDHHKGNNGAGDADRAASFVHRRDDFRSGRRSGAEVSSRAAECLYARRSTPTPARFVTNPPAVTIFAVAGELVRRGVRPGTDCQQSVRQPAAWGGCA